MVKHTKTEEATVKQTVTSEAATASQEKKTITFGNDDAEEKSPLTFLRGTSVLLAPGQVEGRLSFAYMPTKVEQYGTFQRRLYTATLGLNVGLHERVEGWLYLPFGYATGHSTSLFHYGKERESKTELMDIALGFNFLILPESVELPEISLTLSGKAPTGNSPYLYENMLNLGSGHWNATAGINFVLTTDPVVLFWGLSATYTFPAHEYGYEYKYDWTWDYHFGMGMAVNDRMSFNARFMGGYRPALVFDGSKEGRFSDDPMWAGFGFSYRIGDGLVIEPQIVFGLNDAAGDPKVSIGLSKKFN